MKKSLTTSGPGLMGCNLMGVSFGCFHSGILKASTVANMSMKWNIVKVGLRGYTFFLSFASKQIAGTRYNRLYVLSKNK